MQRARRRQDKQRYPCPECWFKKDDCHQGTIPGCCINCGKARTGGYIRCAEPFFNHGKSHCSVHEYKHNLHDDLTASTDSELHGILYDLASQSRLSLLDSSSNTLIIRSTTSTGISGPHSFDFPGPFATRNSDLTAKIDRFVSSNFAPRIRERATTTRLLSEAALARGYFCLLFSATPTIEHERILHNDYYLHTTHSNNNLSQHLLNFILARIEELTSEILHAVRTNNESDDNSNSFDVAAAVGVLYTGLMYVLGRLDSGILRPICGGGELVQTLRRQVSSIAGELIEHARACCPRFNNWAEHIEGPLDDLRCGITQHSLCLTLERRHRSVNITKDPPAASWSAVSSTTEPSQNDRTSTYSMEGDSQHPHFITGVHPTGPAREIYSNSESPDSGYYSFNEKDSNFQQFNDLTCF